jgi:RNA polymerase sigma-70 factor (ECF subfamily)
MPSAEDLPARVTGVLAVLFLVFNEVYLATGPDTDPCVTTRPSRRSGSLA